MDGELEIYMVAASEDALLSGSKYSYEVNRNLQLSSSSHVHPTVKQLSKVGRALTETIA